MKKLFPALAVVLFLSSCQVNDDDIVNTPMASYSYTSSRALPIAVTFTNRSGNIASSSYFWDFGDGSTSTVTNPGTHQYTSYGTYQVKLVEIPVAGVRDTVIQSLNLANTVGPSGVVFRNATASFSYSIANVYTVTFNNGSTYANSFSWDFGNGSTSTSNNPIVTSNFTAPGSYRVRLIATGANGTDSCSDVITF